MTTPPRTASALGITTTLALAVLLVMASCEVPIPTRQGPEAQQSVVESSQKDMIRLQVERNGSVVIDGESYLVEEVSEAVRPLYEASEGSLVAYIGGDAATPYRAMDRLQSELVEAGVLRVVFEIPEVASSMSTSGLGEFKDEGLPVVLPDGGAGRGPARPVTGEPGPGEVQVSVRNILEMVVLTSGIVEVRRGNSPDVVQLKVEDIGKLWVTEVAANPNLIAVVKTDPEAPYRSMTEVLSALQEARAERISVQVLEMR